MQDTDGVLITDIERDSPLVEKGVEPGAVLLAVAGEPREEPKRCRCCHRQSRGIWAECGAAAGPPERQ